MRICTSTHFKNKIFITFEPLYEHLYIMGVENGQFRFFEENTSSPLDGEYELRDDSGESEKITQQTRMDFLRFVRNYECEYIFHCSIPTWDFS